MNAPSLSKSTPRSENVNSLRAATSASITSAPLRTTTGTHSVQPVATSVSTIVCTKLPAADVPAWATKSTSTKPGGGSFQSPNVRRNRTPYRRAEACAPAPAAARDEPHPAQQPVHAGRADLQQQAADLGVNRQSTVPLERGKQDGHERLEAFRADPVRSLPHCDQRFADRIAVTAAGPPLRRRPLLPGPQQSDRVLAMIAADRN